MKFHLSVGRSLKPLFPLLNTWGGQGAMIVRCLMESSGFCALAPNGGIFQNILGLGRPFTSASGNGVTTARSSRFFATFIFVCEKTGSSIWIPGWSIPRQSGPLGLPAVLEKRGPQEPQHHCLGRSRGGLTPKIHLVCYSQVRRLYCYGMQPAIPLRKMHLKPRSGLSRPFDGLSTKKQRY